MRSLGRCLRRGILRICLMRRIRLRTSLPPSPSLSHPPITNTWNTDRNAVLTYAVTTLRVKHVVVMGHYGCGGVAASMAPLPRGYRERWLSPTSLSLPPSFDSPPDLAVQRWIAPIRHIYETSGRWEIREHREKVDRVLRDGEATEEEVSRALMGPPGEEGVVRGVRGLHLHDEAFRALVEENVKANVWRVTRSQVIREVRFPPLFWVGLCECVANGLFFSFSCTISTRHLDGISGSLFAPPPGLTSTLLRQPRPNRVSIPLSDRCTRLGVSPHPLTPTPYGGRRP